VSLKTYNGQIQLEPGVTAPQTLKRVWFADSGFFEDSSEILMIFKEILAYNRTIYRTTYFPTSWTTYWTS
jgi:hypothetical protein